MSLKKNHRQKQKSIPCLMLLLTLSLPCMSTCQSIMFLSLWKWTLVPHSQSSPNRHMTIFLDHIHCKRQLSDLRHTSNYVWRVCFVHPVPGSEGGRKGGTQFTWSQLVTLDSSRLEFTVSPRRSSTGQSTHPCLVRDLEL